MSWRVVVVSKRAKLSLKTNHLIVRDEEIKRVFLGDISTLILQSTSISITTALLCELSKRKIKVIFCDEKHNPFGELIPYHNAHDTSLKYRKQKEWDSDTKDMMWQSVIKEKIKKQALVLSYYNSQQAKLLESYISDVREGDVTNREGHAAKVYFNAMYGSDFYRHTDCNINAALDYGYTIILSAINREIVANGYATQLGINHKSMYNPFNLGCDLMEPLRPLVDKTVKEMDVDVFDSESKLQLVNLLNRKVEIKRENHFLNHAIGIYVRSFFDAIDEEKPNKIRYINYAR